MVYIPNPGLPRIWRIFLLGSLTHVAAMSMVNMSPEIAVTYENKELLKEFDFSCDDAPWIIEGPNNTCNENNTYVMLFNQEGNILETKQGELKAVRTSVNKPTTTNSDTDLSFLFRLVWGRYGVKIMSSDGKVLTATADWKLVMVNKTNPCPTNNEIKDVDQDVLQLACESRGECPMMSNVSGSPNKGPILPDECPEGRWKLVKTGIFLEVRNAKDESKRLAFSGGTLILDNLGEHFTGINTNFRTGYHLDKSNTTALKPYEDIPDNAYGDVVIEFQDRNGQMHESFVCDYNWDQDDSKILCSEMNYTSSIPTFDGVYSLSNSLSNSDFAISGVQCDSVVDSKFGDCPFKVLENENDKLFQRNMKAFGGKGYSCAPMTYSLRDVGGVVCGSNGQITELLKNEIKCEEDLQQNGALGRMFSLQKQVKKFSDTMSEQKHWSEFLLPIPLSVTLLASVILTSGNARPITLKKPDQGFAHLKYNSLEGNLIFVSNSIADSFFVSNSEMIAVKLEAENIHRYVSKIVKYAYRSPPNARRVKKYLKKMTASATLQVEHVDIIIESFHLTNSKLDELLEVLGETDSMTLKQKQQINRYVEINKSRNQKWKKHLKKLKKEYDDMKNKTKEAETKFFERSEELLLQRCIYNGTTQCKTCKHQENFVESTEGGEKVCDVPRKTICLRYESIESKCLDTIQVCDNWVGCCICSKYYSKCVKYQKTTQCTEYDDQFCPNYKYRPAGSYCETDGMVTTDLCGKCNHNEYVTEDMEKMTKYTSNILKNVLYSKHNNDELVSFLDNNLKKFADLLSSLQDYKNHIQEKEEVDLNSKDKSVKSSIEEPSTLSEENKSVKSSMEEHSNSSVKSSIVTPSNSSVKSSKVTPSTSSEDDKSVQKSTKEHYTNSKEFSTASSKLDKELRQKQSNVTSIISVIKPLLQTAELLFNNEKTDEKMLTDLCQRILKTLDDISKGIKGLNTEAKVKTLLSNVESIIQESQRLRNNLLKMKANDSPTIEVTGMKRLGQEFISYQDSVTKRARLDKDISSLSQKMEESIDEILAKEFEGQDMDSVITYLRETSKQLTHISKLWMDLRVFFKFVAEVVKRTQTHASDAEDELFGPIEKTVEETHALIDNLKLDKDTLEELKESTVAAMAYNSYTYRIAKFYTSLMVGSGEGLLAKLKLVPNDRNKFRGPNYDETKYKRYKTLLKNEATATQRQIRDDIKREEKIIHTRLADNIKNIENQFACALKDADTEEKKETAIQLVSTTLAVKNRAKNSKNIPTAKLIKTPEPRLQLEHDLDEDEYEDVDVDYFEMD